MNQAAAAPTTHTLRDLTETVPCPMCKATAYTVVLPALYPPS